MTTHIHLQEERYFLSHELDSVSFSCPEKVFDVQKAIQAKILDANFPCVAAKASVNTQCYAFGLYGELSSEESTLALAEDLSKFICDQDKMESNFTTFIATFETASLSEIDFESKLWQQLRALHASDDQPYSKEVNADPEHAQFGFSFGGRAFFVIGLHPNSSRLARTFPFVTLVFNAHRQFQALRDAQRFERMQQVIRSRDVALQGSLNPNLADYGQITEARQYSGRAVESDWQAPFPRCPLGHG